MNQDDFSSAKELIESRSHITIFSHVRPDGDAYGSILGLGISLRALGKTVLLYNEEGMIPLYRFMPQSDTVETTPDTPPPDSLLIAIDTATQERLGKAFNAWGIPVDIVIDHHASNPRYGQSINIIRPDLPSSASIVQELIEYAGWPLDQEVATCLYSGLSTDTGSFKYRGTTAETLLAAGRLVAAGADPAQIAMDCYQSLTPARFELARMALHTTKLEMDNRLAWLEFTPTMFQESGADPGDTEGVVERLQEIGPVEVAVAFETMSPELLRVSLRSKGRADVSAIASSFGGGGHRAAAGIRMRGNPQQNIEKLLSKVRETLDSE